MRGARRYMHAKLLSAAIVYAKIEHHTANLTAAETLYMT